MEMLIYLTTVVTLVNFIALVQLYRLRRKYSKAQRTVKHLSRSIEKLNSKNGHLWYQLAQSKSLQLELQQETTQTGMTITKI